MERDACLLSQWLPFYQQPFVKGQALWHVKVHQEVPPVKLSGLGEL